jgi:hypothetical protein
MVRTNALAVLIAGMWARDFKLTANVFLTQLHDCFVVPPVMLTHQPDSATAACSNGCHKRRCQAEV